MKSLSPNAQEFIPFSYSQPSILPQQQIQTFLLGPPNGTNSPILHYGYQNVTFGYQTNPNQYSFYPPSQIFVPPPQTNQYFYSNQPLQKPQNIPNKSKPPQQKILNQNISKNFYQGPKFNLNDFPVLFKNEPVSLITEPYQLDDKTLKKNVNFNKESLNTGAASSRSFKDVVQTPKVEKTVVDTNQNVDENTKKKKKRRRPKKSNSETETKNNEILKNNDVIIQNDQFLLNFNEFPDLNASLKNDLNKSFNDDRHLSDAYSSDATLDANAFRLRSRSQLSETDKSTTTATTTATTKTNSKKLHQPLTIEFANMISALQKGQNQHVIKTRVNNYVAKTQIARPVLNMNTSRIGQNNFLINPLDTTSTVKRGKERENPKSKKKSTLKKIILKEREEKRKKRQEKEIESQNEDKYSSIIDLTRLFTTSNDEIEKISDDEDEQNELNESDENTEILSPISQPSPLSINGYNPSPYSALNMASNDMNSISLEKLEEQVKQKIHSRKFREYCNQIVNKDIDEICLALLHEIVRFQDRLYHKFPNKAKVKRRYVMGIREVTKHLKLQKLKCVIIAPNCEKIETKGGLDDAINVIIQTSMEQNIPFLFALGRKDLGKAVKKLVPISVIGIFDYSGAEEHFRRLVQLANNAKLAYQDMVEELEREECENLISQSNQESVKNDMPNSSSNFMPKIPSHMAHSRTPSNGSNISIEPFYHMNYHTHSRSASGNFNYGHTTLVSGHNRSASGGGIGPGGINLDFLVGNKNWTHSRTPSNCSNISFISRMSEPISEVNTFNGVNANSTSAQAAVQFYTEQVRQEMKENDSVAQVAHEEVKNQVSVEQKETEVSASLSNLHLGCINEMDAGNEADTEDFNEKKSKLNIKC